MTGILKISADWYDEDKRVIHSYFSEGWAWDELYVAHRQMCALANTVPHEVYWLLTGAARNYFPRGNPFPVLQYMARNSPSNGHFMVLVSYNPFVRSLEKVVRQLIPHNQKVIFVNALEEAIKRIEAQTNKPLMPLVKSDNTPNIGG